VVIGFRNHRGNGFLQLGTLFVLLGILIVKKNIPWTRPHFISKDGLMNNLFNEDFLDFIRALNENAVDYILVGGYAVILHGYSRTTGDMDIWVHADGENYLRLVGAFHAFGMSVFDMTKERFLNQPHYDVFTFGRPPVCIDIITYVKGLHFQDAFSAAQWFEIDDNLSVRTLSLQSLLMAKQASARHKDLDDIENLSNG